MQGALNGVVLFQFPAAPNGFCPIGTSFESRSSISRARGSRRFSGFHFCTSHIAQPENSPSVRAMRQAFMDESWRRLLKIAFHLRYGPATRRRIVAGLRRDDKRVSTRQKLLKVV